MNEWKENVSFDTLQPLDVVMVSTIWATGITGIVTARQDDELSIWIGEKCVVTLDRRAITSISQFMIDPEEVMAYVGRI